jgi:SAM-dependent methyltransferase
MAAGSTDSESLKTGQYKDSSNLFARAELHQQFSTNPTGWHDWVFNQFSFPEKSRILELGSGPGYLWQQYQTRLQNSWDILLTDISEGMLQEARSALRDFKNVKFTGVNTCAIPFPEHTFDAVIANHMLYHVPDLPTALKEIKRVLKHNCCLYAATNGRAHLHEIRDWKNQFFPDQGGADWGTITLGFSVENGEDLLQQEFSEIRYIEYPDSLRVDQVEPIIDYIRSYTKLIDADSGTKQLRDFLQNLISENGSIQITKESGVFTAFKR